MIRRIIGTAGRLGAFGKSTEPARPRFFARARASLRSTDTSDPLPCAMARDSSFITVSSARSRVISLSRSSISAWAAEISAPCFAAVSIAALRAAVSSASRRSFSPVSESIFALART